jgi:hypothetical protein
LERIEKPWGHEILFAVAEKYIGKILFIKKGPPTKSAIPQTKRRDLLLLEGES